jgi:hypothetical protein
MSLADQWRDRIGAGHSPLYFIYSRLGLLFGESTRALRSTSALAGAAAILGLTGMAGAMGLRRVLPVLWPLAALEPYWLNLGTNMRYMMPMLAAATLTTWAAAAHAACGRRRDGAFLALATALLLWLHASAQFFALGLLIFIVWEGMARPGGSVWRGLGRAWPVAAGILASLPLLYLIRHHSSYLKPEFPKFRDIKRDLLEVVFNDYRLWPRFFHFSDRGIYYAEIVLLAAAVALAYWELRRRPTARRLLLATLTAVPAGFVLTCGLVRDFQGPERYLLLFGLPALQGDGVDQGQAF